MNLVYVGFAIYVISDIIFSVLRAERHAARKAAYKKTMSMIKNVVECETSSSDEKIGSLRSMLDNNLLA